LDVVEKKNVRLAEVYGGLEICRETEDLEPEAVEVSNECMTRANWSLKPCYVRRNFVLVNCAVDVSR
jgi:hypothetical protein